MEIPWADIPWGSETSPSPFLRSACGGPPLECPYFPPMTAMTSSTDDGTQRILYLGSAHVIGQLEYTVKAGIAQLGEQQTEVLEVACSIHAPGIRR